ncbi:MoaD/ThiS family protein [Pseudonocardia asaccharolytica]|uniref:Molybdopterin synthase sulfur carrier subunit n=1 Tax=Pseudonocardia asaccharolytica DSM 44247 = NBRC 16224 TaxID=1123024 RepID=A0A511CWT5_9PSEU|nr:MoaD/ThiS family protein [Pseudonocardia asaccharolytica]GEL17030.1 molybdopterin synthase sulfur carrier subunit [Pseudonocardia asaccharolytica DSM 44247 = NBRC 16224]
MTPTTTGTVTVRYYAAARAAAGIDDEPVALAAGSTLADLLAALRERHGAEFATVLSRCSYLLDEVAVHDHGVVLPDGATLDILPPFAGG